MARWLHHVLVASDKATRALDRACHRSPVGYFLGLVFHAAFVVISIEKRKEYSRGQTQREIEYTGLSSLNRVHIEAKPQFGSCFLFGFLYRTSFSVDCILQLFSSLFFLFCAVDIYCVCIVRGFRAVFVLHADWLIQ